MTRIDCMPHSAPYNIAIEEGLRTAAREGRGAYLLTYVNAPCVVVGRNQDPGAELSQGALRSGSPPAFRRTSGGGAVYHDEGNLNWSFVVPGALEDRGALLAMVISALRSLGVPAEPGARGGILARGRKIGGTASAAGGGALLFHGTLLVSSDLSALWNSLAAHAPGYASGPVASRPSDVANADEFAAGLDTARLALAIATAAGTTGAETWDSALDAESVAMSLARYSSPEWIFERKGIA